MEKSGSMRKWRWVLGLSLALNLLVIGTFAGAAWRHAGKKNAPHHAGVSGSGSFYMRSLPNPERQEFYKTLRQQQPEDRGARREVRRAQVQGVVDALMAEPFDPSAVQALLEGQRTSALARQDAVQAVWLDVVARMDAPTRQAYATALLERAEQHGKRKRRWRE